MAPANYGDFAPLVTTATTLLAAVGALLAGLKRRARWEPVEEDLDRGAQRLGGAVAAVAVGAIWALLRSPEYAPDLVRMVAASIALALVSFCVYSLLIGNCVYEQVKLVDGKVVKVKVIGGFRLTSQARDGLARAGGSKRKLFEGAGYDVGLVWTKPSRAIAKLCFGLSYIALTSSLAIAVATISVLVDIIPHQQPSASDNRESRKADGLPISRP